MTPPIHLTGKVAIITGASRGIGEAIARAFVAAGAKVVLTARKADALESVARSLGDHAFPVAAHAGKEADAIRVVEEAARHFGKVDVLVNNAATNPYFGSMMDADMAAWDKTFEVNVKGYYWTSRELVRHLEARKAGGSIVHITSVAALLASPMQGIYAMTKAAIVSMTKTLAYELAPRGVRVNAIAPGFVDTRFAAAVVHNEALAAEVIRRTPLGRVARPEEIAGGAVYLASDAASYVTGHVLAEDGGMTAA